MFVVVLFAGTYFCGWLKKSQKLEPPIYIADTNGTNLMWTVWITQFKNRPLYGQRTFSWRTMITVLARSVFKKSCTFNSHPSPPLRKGQGRERDRETERDPQCFLILTWTKMVFLIINRTIKQEIWNQHWGYISVPLNLLRHPRHPALRQPNKRWQ